MTAKWPRVVARAVDAALEASIVGSFTRTGPALRARLFDWNAHRELTGRRIAVTGTTSGIGEALVHELHDLGADVCLVARDAVKAESLRAELERRGDGRVDVVLADLAVLDDVVAAADQIAAGGSVHGFVHNAGALFDEHARTVDGLERTVQLHVVAPFLLTQRLLDAGSTTGDPSDPTRVVWMASGGMYTERLDVATLEMDLADFAGATAYARAKRAQVALVDEANRRLPADVVSFVMHPGWVDTPGVASSLPTFHRVIGPLLRAAEDGADTAAWLLSTDPAPDPGGVWLDRRRRKPHKLPWTRGSDEPGEAARLWEWCVARAGPDSQSSR